MTPRETSTAAPSGDVAVRLTALPSRTRQRSAASFAVTRVRYGPRVKGDPEGAEQVVEPVPDRHADADHADRDEHAERAEREARACQPALEDVLARRAHVGAGRRMLGTAQVRTIGRAAPDAS